MGLCLFNNIKRCRVTMATGASPHLMLIPAGSVLSMIRCLSDACVRSPLPGAMRTPVKLRQVSELKEDRCVTSCLVRTQQGFTGPKPSYFRDEAYVSLCSLRRTNPRQLRQHARPVQSESGPITAPLLNTGARAGCCSVCPGSCRHVVCCAALAVDGVSAKL
jgi:hypothetical protein